jgi:hypothetical protein
LGPGPSKPGGGSKVLNGFVGPVIRKKKNGGDDEEHQQRPREHRVGDAVANLRAMTAT